MNLKDLLDESCIDMDLPLKSKAEVFDTMIHHLYEAGIIQNENQFRQAVEYRETLSSPSYIRLKEPIEWESMDGKPIQHIFLMAIPANGDKTHIKMLSELAMMLVRKEAREALNEIQSPQQLYEIL